MDRGGETGEASICRLHQVLASCIKPFAKCFFGTASCEAAGKTIPKALPKALARNSLTHVPDVGTPHAVKPACGFVGFQIH